MTKNIPAHIQSAINNLDVKLARCWKIVRVDGTTYGFTDHDFPLVINIGDGGGNFLYQPNLSFNTEATSIADELEVDGSKMVGIIDSNLFSEAEIIAGLFDSAQIYYFLVDHTNPSAGIVKLLRGWLGEFERRDFGFSTEVRGLTQLLQNNVVSLYAARCRSKFGDTGTGTSGGCRFNVYSVTQQVTVSVVSNRKTFTVSGLNGPILDGTGGTKTGGYFALGTATFLSGLNISIKKEISTHINNGGSPNSSVITLLQALPFDLQIGDIVSLAPGCDKSLEVCRDSWNKVVDFRGEPYLPGEDFLFRITKPPSS